MSEENSSHDSPSSPEISAPQGEGYSNQNNDVIRNEGNNIIEGGNALGSTESSSKSMIEEATRIAEIEKQKNQEEIARIRDELGLPNTDKGHHVINGGQHKVSTQQISESQSPERIENSEIPPDHEKYHTIEAEQFRYDKVFSESSSSRKVWAEFRDTVASLHPDPAVKGSNTFYFEQMIEQQRSSFEDSLNNPNEQKVRREQREVVIGILESIYNQLNQEVFKNPDPNIRQSELLRILHETGIRFDNKEIQSLIERQYFKFKKPPERGIFIQDTSEVIENKDEFIENGLTYLDPYIFAEAQQRVLGQAKPMVTPEDILEMSTQLSDQEIESQVKARNEYFKRDIFKINEEIK